jgi:hypothetical protein
MRAAIKQRSSTKNVLHRGSILVQSCCVLLWCSLLQILYVDFNRAHDRLAGKFTPADG